MNGGKVQMAAPINHTHQQCHVLPPVRWMGVCSNQPNIHPVYGCCCWRNIVLAEY